MTITGAARRVPTGGLESMSHLTFPQRERRVTARREMRCLTKQESSRRASA